MPASFKAPIDDSFYLEDEARRMELTRRAMRSEPGILDLYGLSVPGPAFTPAALQTTQDLANNNMNYRSPDQQASDPKYTGASKKYDGLKDSDAIPSSKPHNGEDTNAEKKREWSAPPEDARQHGVKHTKREGGVWRWAFRLFKPGTKSSLQVVQE